MKLGLRNFVKLNGLNKRLISVETLQIIYFDEHEIEGKLVTNIHFANGRWVTANHSLDEVHAICMQSDSDNSEEEKQEMERYKRMATERIKSQREIAEALKEANILKKHNGFKKALFADGSGRLTIDFGPDDAKV